MQRPRNSLPLLTESLSPAWEECRSSRLSPDLGLQRDSLLAEAIQFADPGGGEEDVPGGTSKGKRAVYISSGSIVSKDIEWTFFTTIVGWGQNSLSCG